MANATSVTTPSPKSIASTSPSLLDCVDNVENESQVTNDLDAWLAKLKGVTKLNVDALIKQLDEKEEIIDTLESQSDEFANEIASLSKALEEEQTRRSALEEKYASLDETYGIDMARLKKDNEHSIALANVLKKEKSELGVGNARLIQENENLERELKALKESHNQLLGQLVKEKIFSLY